MGRIVRQRIFCQRRRSFLRLAISLRTLRGLRFRGLLRRVSTYCRRFWYGELAVKLVEAGQSERSCGSMMLEMVQGFLNFAASLRGRTHGLGCALQRGCRCIGPWCSRQRSWSWRSPTIRVDGERHGPGHSLRLDVGRRRGGRSPGRWRRVQRQRYVPSGTGCFA
jgi:hypothetical protein